MRGYSQLYQKNQMNINLLMHKPEDSGKYQLLNSPIDRAITELQRFNCLKSIRELRKLRANVR